MGQFVKYYSSLETGAPVLNNVAGAATNVFDAILVNGFNSKTVTSLVVTGNVATASITGHSFDSQPNLDLDITFEGADPAALNGSKMVTIIDANTVTFPAPGVADGAATGTIRAKRSPLGWAKPFSGTSRGIYKPTDITASGQMFRVDDTVGSNRDFRAVALESATGIDTFTDAFPTTSQVSGGLYWTKGEITSRAKNWMVVGDSKFFYFIVEATGYSASALYQNRFAIYYFGDILSIRPADSFSCAISGGWTATSTGGTTNVFPRNNSIYAFTAASNYASFIARDYTALTKSALTNTAFPFGEPGSSDKIFPSPVNNGMIFVDGCILTEQGTSINNPVRGYLPGASIPLVGAANLVQTPIFDIKETISPSFKYLIIAGVNIGTGTTTYNYSIKVDTNWRA